MLTVIDQLSLILDDLELIGKYFPTIEPNLVLIFNLNDWRRCRHGWWCWKREGQRKNLVAILDLEDLILNVYGKENMNLSGIIYERFSEVLDRDDGGLILTNPKKVYEEFCIYCWRYEG